MSSFRSCSGTARSLAMTVFAAVAVWAMIAKAESTSRNGDVEVGEETDGVPKAVAARRARVIDELAQGTTEPWAGEYYQGDGLGFNRTLHLAPKAGVSATWFGCMGLYGANEGEVVVIDRGKLAFRFSAPNFESGREGFPTFPGSVNFVQWGQRRYLVPDDRMLDFVNAVNHRMEPSMFRGSLFLAAAENAARPVSGLPDLPEVLRSQIRTVPLDLRVSSVEPLGQRKGLFGKACAYRLHFDLPAGETLIEGLELSPRVEGVYEDARVVRIDGSRVVAELVFDKACWKVAKRPSKRWIFTTGGIADDVSPEKHL